MEGRIINLKKIVKFLKEWKWALLLLSFCLVGIPLTTIYGIQSVNWGNDFWPNALSEFLGMFVDLIFSALFTFVVIDKYLQYHKNSQWKRIKNVTYKNLYFLLSNILLKLNLSFPQRMQVQSYALNEDMETLNDYLPKEDFDIFITSLIQNIDALIMEKRSARFDENSESDFFADTQIHASLMKFKQHSKSDINAISGSLVIKLLTFSDDPLLLDDVVELEELYTSLMTKINNVHKKGYGDAGANVKYIWLIKIQEILTRIKAIADYIQDDITID